MRILSLAHLTVSRNFVSSLRSLPAPYLTELDLINNIEKLAFMSSHAERHSLYLHKLGPITLESVEYFNQKIEHEIVSKQTVLRNLDLNNRIIKSSSFSSDFIGAFTSVFSRITKIDKHTMQVPSLIPGMPITFAYDPATTRFSEFLDGSGLVAIAFWVDNLDGLEQLIESNLSYISKKTRVFKQSVSNKKMKIAFIQIQGVNIELISRIT